MKNIDEKEIQKTLDEISKRTEEFQSGENYSPDNKSSPNHLMVILATIGIIVVLIIATFFYSKGSGSNSKIKAPAGYEVVYPKNAPPRLQKNNYENI